MYDPLCGRFVPTDGRNEFSNMLWGIITQFCTGDKTVVKTDSSAVTMNVSFHGVGKYLSWYGEGVIR